MLLVARRSAVVAEHLLPDLGIFCGVPHKVPAQSGEDPQRFGQSYCLDSQVATFFSHCCWFWVKWMEKSDRNWRSRCGRNPVRATRTKRNDSIPQRKYPTNVASAMVSFCVFLNGFRHGSTQKCLRCNARWLKPPAWIPNFPMVVKGLVCRG